ncbi:MAG: M23 family metallopeptidase [Alphaproteobacteria bacterium]
MKVILTAVALLLAVSGPCLAGELQFRGEAVQGGLVIGQAEPGTKIDYAGHRVKVTPDGIFVIGFHRDDPPDMAVTATFPDGGTATHRFSVRQRDYDIQRIDGLPQSKVTPPDDVIARIQEDARQVRNARAIDSDATYFAGNFIWPATGRISGVYGSQRVLNGEPRQPHYGVDIAAPVGTPVIAPAAGTVTLAHPDMYFSGATLMIDHGHGVQSAFLHMSRIDVKPGQFVQQGDVIGAIGQSGRATGPHLDWRINWFEKRIDPQLIASPFPGN